MTNEVKCMNDKKYDLIMKVIKGNTESTPIKTLSFIIANMDENNISKVTYKEMEEFVGLHKRAISVYIKRFKDTGIIEVSKNGRFNVYKVNM